MYELGTNSICGSADRDPIGRPPIGLPSTGLPSTGRPSTGRPSTGRPGMISPSVGEDNGRPNAKDTRNNKIEINFILATMFLSWGLDRRRKEKSDKKTAHSVYYYNFCHPQQCPAPPIPARKQEGQKENQRKNSKSRHESEYPISEASCACANSSYTASHQRRKTA